MKLFDYQIAPCKAIVTWSSESTETIPTLIAPMAAGKTAISCTAIGIIDDKRIWVVVNRIELLHQWRSELEKFSPHLTNKDIGFIHADKKKEYYKRIQLVQVQTLTSRLSKIIDANLPDVVILDEAHETGFNRVINKLRERKPFKQINLTATPCRHGRSNIQYEDLFNKEHWLSVTTQRALIANGRWKQPVWLSASEKLAEVTASRFSGLKITGGEYDNTDQASVMIDLLPEHIHEWFGYGGDKHSCVWFCVNVEHSKKVEQALRVLGRKVGIITGETNPKERACLVEDFKQGLITDLVNCQCLTTGFDAPIASCSVWLRRTLSVGLWCQMAGRVLRRYEGVTEALMLDLAGNLGEHPFPEDIDWWVFNPSKKVFRDPKLSICQSCGHRHVAESIPTPIGKKDNPFLISYGMFYNGEDLENPDAPLKCHNCLSTVKADLNKLNDYATWLSACRKAKKAIKPHFSSAGLLIGGNPESHYELVSAKLLYDLGIWQISDQTEKAEPDKDKSDEYRVILSKSKQRFTAKDLKELKLQRMTDVQRDYLNCHPVISIYQLDTPEKRYRMGIVWAYVNDRSPTWAYHLWGSEEAIPDNLISSTLRTLDRDLVDGWLSKWSKYHDDKGEFPKKGVVDRFIKLCNNVVVNAK
jgi:DNA repair protein RadD